MALIEGFLTSLATTLGLPLGTKRRKANDGKPSSNADDIDNSTLKDYINSIIDIVADDVVMNGEPIFYTAKEEITNADIRNKLDSLKTAFNGISRWVAFDLLKYGYSVYSYKVVDDNLSFFPLNENFKFYYTNDGIRAKIDNYKSNSKYYDYSKSKEDDNNDGDYLSNVLIFIYYEKDSFKRINDEIYEIVPSGIQTKNCKRAILDVSNIERALQRLRIDGSRVVRFITFDAGYNLGDVQQQMVDDISDGINANSGAIDYATEFDDQIPIFPTRGGTLGKPNYEEFVPNIDYDKISDLDYFLSKLFLSLKFPKDYADFTKTMSSGNVLSLVKSDLRYAKLLTTCRNTMIKIMNDFVKDIPVIQQYGIYYDMEIVPTSQDSDLVEQLDSRVRFIGDILTDVDSTEDIDVANAKVDIYRTLFSSTTNSKHINDLLDSIDEYMKVKTNAMNGIENFDTLENGMEDVGNVGIRGRQPKSVVESIERGGEGEPAVVEEQPINESEEA